MKIKSLALVLLLLFSLSSCTEDDLKVVNIHLDNYYTELVMSGEIQTQQVKKGEPFEIKVGFGQLFGAFVYSEATLIIMASDFKILLPDGTSFENTYERKIVDFSEDKYGFDDELKMPCHIESFRFIYTGGEKEHTEKILFWITRLLPERDDGQPGQDVSVYYKVRGEHITLTTKPPKGLNYH